MARQTRFYDGWSTGTKLLILLTLALFPLGLALAWTARSALLDAHAAVVDDSFEDGKAAARATESLIARNALALRVAANAAMLSDPASPCQPVAQALALTPAIASRFTMRDATGRILCIQGNYTPSNNSELVAPGALRLWIDPGSRAVRYRVGVNGGMATGELARSEFAQVVQESNHPSPALRSRRNRTTLDVSPLTDPGPTRLVQYPIALGQLTAWSGLSSPNRRCSTGWWCSCRC